MLEKVLCVDDDPITLMLCKKVIGKANLSKAIDSAANGEDALAYFDRLKAEHPNGTEDYPKLIFLDLNMPVMNGWEFLDHFRKEGYLARYPHTQVIVLSSTIDPEDIAKSKQYPMVIEFLSKPITLEILEILKKNIGL